MENIRKKADICLKNIERSQSQRKSADIRSSAHIKELAALVSSLIPKDLLNEDGEDFRRIYKDLCAELSFEDRMELCSFIAGENLSYSFAKKLLDVREPKNDVTLVYVKNALSDIAFEKFSASFNKAQVYYAADFEEALEDVYYSKADYAILPIASSKNGRILHFSELALRYEMKTVLSCTVHSNTDGSDNTFILAAKNIEFLFGSNEENIRFEFLLNDPANNLTSILCAASHYGCGYITSYASPENNFALIELDISQGQTDALCLYLFLEFSRHIPIGIYTLKKQP